MQQQKPPPPTPVREMQKRRRENGGIKRIEKQHKTLIQCSDAQSKARWDGEGGGGGGVTGEQKGEGIPIVSFFVHVCDM